MASYTNMLAEKVFRTVAEKHELRCYHDVSRDQRIQDISETIYEFCREYRIGEIAPKEPNEN